MNNPVTRLVYRTLACLVSLMIVELAGCNVVGFILQGPFGGSTEHKVEARYSGLPDQEIAVMVSADESLLFHYPEARSKICKMLSAQLATSIPGIKLVQPDDVLAFTERQPAWTTIPFGQLLDKLAVGRIVHVDLMEYRTNEPGNANVQRGQITAKIGVVDSQSATPDDYVYLESVSTHYPDSSTVGVVNTNLAAIETGMVDVFALAVTNLFRDYTVMKP